MAYVDKLLAREERVILQSRRHPLFMLLNCGPYLIGALLLWALAVLAVLVIPDVAGVPVGPILGIGLILVSLVPLGIGIYRIIHWLKEEYIVTNYRIIQVEGFVNRRTYDSALEKVNDVILEQSVFGRMFDYGTINIVTGSDAAINDIAGVAKPYEFKRALLEAKLDFGRWDSDEVRQAEPGPARQFASQDPAGGAEAATDRLPRMQAESMQTESDQSRAIIALTELRNSGVITDAEYSEKLRKLTRQ